MTLQRKSLSAVCVRKEEQAGAPGVEGNDGGAVDVPLAPSRTPEEKDRRIWMGLGPEDSMWELTQRDSFGVAPGKS